MVHPAATAPHPAAHRPPPAPVAAGQPQLALAAAGAGMPPGEAPLLLDGPSADPEEEFQEMFNSPKAQKVRDLIDKNPALAARVIEQILQEDSD